MIRFEGHCAVCGETHGLPASAAAVEAARERAPALLRALPPGKGRMLGVLLGVDHAGREVTLQAWSGTTPLPWLALGWAPTTRCVEETRREEEETFRRLNTLSQEIDALGWDEACHHLAQAQERFARESQTLAAGRNQARAEREALRSNAPLDEALREKLRNQSWDESVAYRNRRRELRAPLEAAQTMHRTVLARMQVLKSERRALSNQLQASFDAQQPLTNFRGRPRPQALVQSQERGLHAGTGECAAPKLLTDAARRGVRPTSMAEIWVGAQQESPQRIHGEVYAPCLERCVPILGHLLCGAERPARIPESLGLNLLGEAGQWVAVQKPGGLLSTPGRGVEKLDCVLTRVRRYYARGAEARAAHRLDMETSGVLLVALHRTAQAVLQAQFSQRQVNKSYLAWVEGTPPTAQGTIDLPLQQEARGIRRHIVASTGKPSTTDYLVLGQSGARSLVLCTPRTGRSHQIRVHAAHPRGLGAPIVGDNLYGTSGDILHLHAWRLSFTDPDTQLPVHLCCPIPDNWPAVTAELLARHPAAHTP